MLLELGSGRFKDLCRVVTEHRVGLAGSCLPIHEDCTVYSIQGAQYNVFSGIVEYFRVVCLCIEASR